MCSARSRTPLKRVSPRELDSSGRLRNLGISMQKFLVNLCESDTQRKKLSLSRHPLQRWDSSQDHGPASFEQIPIGLHPIGQLRDPFPDADARLPAELVGGFGRVGHEDRL